MQAFVPFRTRLAVASELRKQGMGIVKAHRLASVVDESFIDAAVASAPDNVQAAYMAATSAVGGPLSDLLEKFLEFLNSDLGKMLIQLILSLLMV